MSGFEVQLDDLDTAVVYVHNESERLARLQNIYRDSADLQKRATKGGTPGTAWGIPDIPGIYDEFAKKYDDFRQAFMKTLAAASQNLLATSNALAKIEEHYRKVDGDAAAHFNDIHQEMTR